MKKLSLILSVILALTVVGCDSTNPAVVQDTPPIHVTVSGNATVQGSVNATVTNSGTNPVPITFATSNATTQTLTVSSDGEASVVSMTMEQEIQEEGTWENQTAYVFKVLGRRTTWTSTSVLNDLKDFDNTVANIPVMTGLEDLQVVSSSVNDVVGGTGAQSVKVTYIDTNGNLVESAAVSLNGTSPVTVAWKSLGIEWMEVYAVGTGGVSAGNIILENTAATVQYEQITAGGNKSMSGRFRIPTSYTGYVSNWDCNAVAAINQFIDFRLRGQADTLTRAFTTPYHFQDTMYALSGGSGMQMFLPYLKFSENATVKISGITSALNNRADASFEIMIIHN